MFVYEECKYCKIILDEAAFRNAGTKHLHVKIMINLSAILFKCFPENLNNVRHLTCSERPWDQT